MPADMIAIKE